MQQVVTLRIRQTTEHPTYMLNRVLPEDIRVTAWARVPEETNARWDCLYRKYKYWFVANHMDIAKMQEAAAAFEGTHSFLHFHKHDAARPPGKHWDRRILTSRIRRTATICEDLYYQTYYYEVCGFAFLWHQVRMMMGALFLVGQGRENVSVIRQMLQDKQVVDGKWAQIPFEMAPEENLVLVDCGFENIDWITDLGNIPHGPSTGLYIRLEQPHRPA